MDDKNKFQPHKVNLRNKNFYFDNIIDDSNLDSFDIENY